MSDSGQFSVNRHIISPSSSDTYHTGTFVSCKPVELNTHLTNIPYSAPDHLSSLEENQEGGPESRLGGSPGSPLTLEISDEGYKVKQGHKSHINISPSVHTYPAEMKCIYDMTPPTNTCGRMKHCNPILIPITQSFISSHPPPSPPNLGISLDLLQPHPVLQFHMPRPLFRPPVLVAPVWWVSYPALDSACAG